MRSRARVRYRYRPGLRKRNAFSRVIGMPFVCVNGIRLAYERAGHGDPVLMIMGQAAGGNVWRMHQVPALTNAGYEVITFENRGVSPSDVPPGEYLLADLVADTAGLIEALGIGPCRLGATSLGGLIAA